ncbi:MAG TPA: hypothetical protein VIB79_12295 [Candidatus Binatia bacterium]|jgi:hypothetical protein
MVNEKPMTSIWWSKKFVVGMLLLCGFFGACSQAAPLSITLMDKKTGAIQKCSARETSSSDTAVLSQAVEMCARQLEAHGYVRVSDAPK